MEEAIAACLEGRPMEFTGYLVEFGTSYAVRVREDHALFVAALRGAEIGVSAT